MCKKCGKSLLDTTEEFCGDCLTSEHFYDRGRAVFQYKNEIKYSIYNFKYKNKREYSQFYLEEIDKTCGDWIRNVAPDVLVPIPLHPHKQRARGYNQAEEIARKMGEFYCIPVADNLLYRVVNTIPQKELSDNNRKKNMKKAFKISENIVELDIAMVIDDIYTTGATMDEVSKLLRRAGFKKIYCLSLCIGDGF